MRMIWEEQTFLDPINCFSTNEDFSVETLEQTRDDQRNVPLFVSKKLSN